MKKILSLIAMCVMASMNVFSQELVITLTHENNTKEFYGADAFQTAVNESQNGDILTFSPGMFNGANIVGKSITLRGNGCDGDAATIISTDLNINKAAIENDPGLNVHGFNLKSIRFTGNTTSENILVEKCTIGYIESEHGSAGWSDFWGRAKNFNLIHCIVKNYTSFVEGSEANFVNCVLADFRYSRYVYTNNFTFMNCVVYMKDVQSFYYVGAYNMKTSFTARNSIVIQESATTFVNPVVFDHSIVTSTAENPVDVFVNASVTASQYMPITSVFKTVTNTSNYVEDSYELTETAAAILGTTGNEIGIHGGNLPYSSTVSYPHFTTFNVAERSTEDFKLSVDIVVE